MQQSPEISKGEKVVNAIGKVIIVCFLPIAWLIRKVKRK